MEKLVSESSKLLIQVLMTDPKISEKILENSTESDKYKNCSILESGTIVLGKTNCIWWNKLINCQDKIPFDSFALKVWDALVDMSSGLNNKAILNGLSLEIVKKSIRSKEYDCVVRRLFDCWSHVAQKSAGYQQAETLGEGKGLVPHSFDNPSFNENREITININGIRKTIPFVDSIGDKLNIELETGIIGFRRLN